MKVWQEWGKRKKEETEGMTTIKGRRAGRQSLLEEGRSDVDVALDGQLFPQLTQLSP